MLIPAVQQSESVIHTQMLFSTVVYPRILNVLIVPWAVRRGLLLIRPAHSSLHLLILSSQSPPPPRPSPTGFLLFTLRALSTALCPLAFAHTALCRVLPTFLRHFHFCADCCHPSACFLMLPPLGSLSWLLQSGYMLPKLLRLFLIYANLVFSCFTSLYFSLEQHCTTDVSCELQV